MQTIKVLTIGKTKEAWIQTGINIYTERLKRHIQLEWILLKNDEQLEQAAMASRHLIALDPQGEEFDSEQFSNYICTQLIKGGSRMEFVIGAENGLPKKIRQNYPLISLSRMTLTHDKARLFLAEQIYRAMQIAHSTPYHK